MGTEPPSKPTMLAPGVSPYLDSSVVNRRVAAPTVMWRVRDRVDAIFGAFAGALLLSIVATIPVLQLLALGYLLAASRRLVESGRLRDAFWGTRAASRIAQLLLGCWLVSLPWRLFWSLHLDAKLVDPSAPAVEVTGVLSVACACIGIVIALLALTQGGHIVHFVRPLRAARRLLAQVKEPEYLVTSYRKISAAVRSVPLVTTFWLGVRGYLITALILAVPTTFIAARRDGPLVLVGGALLVALLLYLPYLQIHFAVTNRSAAMLDVRGVHQAFNRAPLAFLVALLATLTLALPLYLLKIEVVPRDALWLPAMVFVVTIFPTKLICAWAYRRGMKRKQPAHGFWRWSARLLMIPIATFYAGAVFLTQYTGWHGIWGLYEHHVFLLPVPF